MGRVVSDLELAELKREREQYMDSLVDVKRDEVIAPNQEEPVIVASGVRAQITAGYGTFRDVADRFSGITPYTISCPYETDIRPGDWLIEGDMVYNVKDVRRHGTFEIVVNALCDWVH